MYGVGLSLLALSVLPHTIALDFPATIEVDIVFPRNETYKVDNNFPVVFAIQNAEASFAFGFSLFWSITALGNDSEPSRAYVNVGNTPYIADDSDPPIDTTDNIWYFTQNVSFDAELPTLGLHKLEWTWGATECEQDGDDVTVTIGNDQAQGELYFTVVADGRGEDVNLTGDKCPEFGALIYAEDNADWGEHCPIFGKTPKEVKPDPCRAKMPAHLAACAMANVTGSSDRSACERAKELGDGNRGGDDDDAAVIIPVSASWSLITAVLVAVVILI
jgi:hypothetical protein